MNRTSSWAWLLVVALAVILGAMESEVSGWLSERVGAVVISVDSRRAPHPSQVASAGKCLIGLEDGPRSHDGFHRTDTRRTEIREPMSGEERFGVLAEDRQFELLVIDLPKSWMSGLRLIAGSHRSGHRRRVVVMTAPSDSDLAERLIRLGQARRLGVPSSLRQVLDCLGEALGRAPTPS
jgi:CheY-like chemotaxis protein